MTRIHITRIDFRTAASVHPLVPHPLVPHPVVRHLVALHPVVTVVGPPHPVVRHLVALQAVATVVRNESQTLDGLARADPGYGIGVAKALGIELSEEVVRNLMSASTSDGELVAAEVPSSH
jgi:hypothetical protein